MNTTLNVGARLSAMFFFLFLCSTALAGSAKVDVCHIPPDDPESFHTIRINEKALPAHLAHGDFAGACNTICAALCDDGNACTIDDTLDCEEQGCPAFPRDPVDCSDGLACTNDSCDVVNGCGNEPVECVPSDLCQVPICSEPDGECSETPVVCETGDVCDLDTGECVPEEICPCFTLDDLMAGGTIAECGENFAGLPGVAGILYGELGEITGIACSGDGCTGAPGSPSCASSVTGLFLTDIGDAEDGCRTLILEACGDNANDLSSDQAPSDTNSDGSVFTDQL